MSEASDNLADQPHTYSQSHDGSAVVLRPSFALWCTAVYVALFVIRPWERLIPELADLHIERVYAIFMICVVLLAVGFRFSFGFQNSAVLAFFGALVVSTIAAENPSLAWPVLYRYFTVIVFYVVLLLIMRSPWEMLFIAMSYVLSVALYLGKAQWEYFVHGAGVWTMGVWRLHGIDSTYGHPNSVAASAVYSLPVAWFLFASRRDFCSSWPVLHRRLFTWGLAAHATLAVTSIFLTRSRAGMASLALFTVLLSLSARNAWRKARGILLFLVVLGVVWLLLPPDMENRIRTLWDPSAGPASARSSAEGRWEGMCAGLKMWEDRPITGVGLGNFRSYRIANVDGVDSDPHSLIGEVLGEIGALGCAGFVLMVVGVLLNCRNIKRLTHGRDDQESRVLDAWATAACLAVLLLLFNGLAGHNLQRFNWLWIAAFSVVGVEFLRRRL